MDGSNRPRRRRLRKSREGFSPQLAASQQSPLPDTSYPAALRRGALDSESAQNVSDGNARAQSPEQIRKAVESWLRRIEERNNDEIPEEPLEKNGAVAGELTPEQTLQTGTYRNDSPLSSAEDELRLKKLTELKEKFNEKIQDPQKQFNLENNQGVITLSRIDGRGKTQAVSFNQTSGSITLSGPVDVESCTLGLEAYKKIHGDSMDYKQMKGDRNFQIASVKAAAEVGVEMKNLPQYLQNAYDNALEMKKGNEIESHPEFNGSSLQNAIREKGEEGLWVTAQNDPSFVLTGFKDDANNKAQIACEEAGDIYNELLARRVSNPSDRDLLYLVRTGGNYLQGAATNALPEVRLRIQLDENNNPKLHPDYKTRAQELEERLGDVHDTCVKNAAALPRGRERDHELAYQAEVFANMPVKLRTDARLAQLEQHLPEMGQGPDQDRFKQALEREKDRRESSRRAQVSEERREQEGNTAKPVSERETPERETLQEKTAKAAEQRAAQMQDEAAVDVLASQEGAAAVQGVAANAASERETPARETLRERVAKAAELRAAQRQGEAEREDIQDSSGKGSETRGVAHGENLHTAVPL